MAALFIAHLVSSVIYHADRDKGKCDLHGDHDLPTTSSDRVSSKDPASNFRILSTTCLLNCFNNEFSRFIAREISYSQVRDRLPPTDLLFCIHRNLGDLYCHPRGLSINDFNVSFLLLGHDSTSEQDAIFMSLV
jgi:hypothetical protein